MAQASAKIDQNIRKSSQLFDSKSADDFQSHPTDQPHRLAKAKGAKQPSHGNHRRSLLPKKAAPSNSRSTSVLQKGTQHMSVALERNVQVVPDAFSNPSMKKSLIPSGASEEKESLSGSKAQMVPVKNLQRSSSARRHEIVSRLLPASRTTHPKNVTASLGPQSSSSAEIGTANLSVKKDSSSASNVGSISSDSPKSSINYLKCTAARPRIRSESQPAQSNGGVSGHQIAKNSVPEGALLRPKDASSHRLPVKVHRPPIAALQQDFVPNKSSKLAISANPTSVALKPEMLPNKIVRLQMELMQLCVLHRIAIETQRQWEQSAERTLQRRFDVIREEHFRVKRLVQVQKTFEIQAALVSWYGDMTSAELAAKVQLLSRNIFESWQLISSEGEYTRIVQKFEIWFERARGVQSLRKPSIQFTGPDIDFIECIEDGWALEVENMEWRLNSSLSDLKCIGELPENTDFGQLLFSFKKLLSNLLEEMGIIRAIQADIMASEISWIQDCIDDMTQAGGGHTMLSDTETCRGI